MATYFISDIHGEYDLFIKLLKKINFNSHDTLYILGDIIDKGKDSIKLLKFISKQNNMIAIMGNHEHAFSEFVKAVIDKTPTENYNEIISKVQAYFSQDLERITPQEVFFILQLPYFIETEEFICVHAGLEIKDNKILPLEQQQYNYIIYDRKFKNKNFEPLTKTILFGHTPCFYDNQDGKFIKSLKDNSSSNNFSSYSKIRLDTGVSYTKMLGVLRKEDMCEIYIKE